MIEGLLPTWREADKESLRLITTSSSGEPRTDEYLGIPLRLALTKDVHMSVCITAKDGNVLLLSKADADQAYLIPFDDDCLLVLRHDTNRRRRIKSPIAFQTT